MAIDIWKLGPRPDYAPTGRWESATGTDFEPINRFRGGFCETKRDAQPAPSTEFADVGQGAQ